MGLLVKKPVGTWPAFLLGLSVNLPRRPPSLLRWHVSCFTPTLSTPLPTSALEGESGRSRKT